MTKARKKLAETPRPDRDQTWDDRGFGTPVIYLRSERALVSPPAPAAAATGWPWRRSRVLAGMCKGYVLRTQLPPRCKVCREPFTVCPNCDGLVVPKPGWECRDCDYAFANPVPDASQPEQGRPAETPGARPRLGCRQVRQRSSHPQPLPSPAGQDVEHDDLRGSDFDPTRSHSGHPTRSVGRPWRSGPRRSDSPGPPDRREPGRLGAQWS